MELRKLRFPGRESKALALVIVFITSIASVSLLFASHGLPWSHDIVFHLFYSQEFKLSLDSGLMYPRWALDSNNEYGSAFFIFYSPLSYYAVALINYVVPSIVLSMMMAIWAGFFCSGVAMFTAVNRMFGWRGGIISAVFYQILPFHLLDLYARGTSAELLAFVWFPLIIVSIHEAFESEERTAYIGLSLSYAGLILTHLASGFLFTFVIGAYLIYRYALSRRKAPLIKTLLSLTLGLGISAFYLVPVIFERRFVHIEYILNCSVCDYRRNFLFMWDKLQARLEDFYIALHIGVVLEVLLFLLIVLSVWKDSRKSAGPEEKFFIAVFLSAFFLVTPLSMPIWGFLPFLPSLQFPWRWVLVMEVALCFLIGSIFSKEDRPRLKVGDVRRRGVIYCMIALLSISFMIVFNSRILSADFLHRILSPENIKHHMDPTVEYAPIWGSMERILSLERHSKVSVMSGKAQPRAVVWKPEQRIIEVKAARPALLRIATYYYPGWEAIIDGRRARLIIEKDSGAMLVEMPQGTHMLELRFRDTELRYLSKIMSLISCLIIMGLIIIEKRTCFEKQSERRDGIE